jgi:precorrin isomerase
MIFSPVCGSTCPVSSKVGSLVRFALADFTNDVAALVHDADLVAEVDMLNNIIRKLALQHDAKHLFSAIGDVWTSHRSHETRAALRHRLSDLRNGWTGLAGNSIAFCRLRVRRKNCAIRLGWR